MQKRVWVEARMYRDFSEKYWELKSPFPVYFSLQVIEKRLQKRREYEPRTKYLLVNLSDFDDTDHVSFTVSDSMMSYRKLLEKEGFAYKEAPVSEAYADHGKIFHIHEIDRLISKYPNDDDLYFEVQVWDKDVLYAWKRKTIQASQKPACKALADIVVGR